MATFTSGLAASNQAFKPPGGGIVGVREAIYDFTAAFVLNDVIQMVPVAPGERVIDLQFVVETDLDTATGITIDIGDGDDPDRYVAASTIGQTGGLVRYGQGIATAVAAVQLDKKYSVADTIDVLIKTAATSGAPTSGRLRMRAWIVSAN